MADPLQQETSTNRKLVVMVSSTARDLPAHRDQIKEACLRQGMFPLMMEHLPATDADAITASLKMVDEADIYLGIFAYRYGYIPRGQTLSITEMEYNRAVTRGIPRLIFLIDEKHRITIADIEQGDGMAKLAALKARLQTEHVVNYFSSPEDLLGKVINSLASHRQSSRAVFHYVSDIPAPPKEYIAHPYTLLQTPSLIGRQSELNLLTDWVSNPNSALYSARILCVVGIGGMGKSALTWKWFHDSAPHEMPSLKGRMWWSFYESDASFDHFITRALAYVSRRSLEELKSIPRIERETQLLTTLDQKPYLLVLDGLERILLAYARLDANRLLDDELDQQTANFIAEVQGLPESAAQSFVGQYQLRKTTDTRVGTFLQKLSAVRASRILVSTRLYPADLQTTTGNERPGSKAYFLRGLTNDDALNIWRAFGVSGSRDALFPLFRSFENHPLLIQVLAGVVAQDRSKPGDFDDWRKRHPDFDPFQLPLIQARSHILAFALRGLSETAEKVLFTIAAFRMPTSYDTLVALFVGEKKPLDEEDNLLDEEDNLFVHEDGLVSILVDLEDRGLLGWDRRANRYDLHPIVRGVTWSRLGKQTKHAIYETLNGYFDSLPEVDEEEVQSIDDLTVGIELYYTLIGLERFDDAYELFEDRLAQGSIFRLGFELQTREMLEALFPQGIAQKPHVSEPDNQFAICFAMALCCVDQVAEAVRWYQRHLKNNAAADGAACSLLVEQLCFCGLLYEAELVAFQSQMVINHSKGDGGDETFALVSLGLVLVARGNQNDSEKAFERMVKLVKSENNTITVVFGYSSYAISSLWLAQFIRAYALAQEVEAIHKKEKIYERLRLRSMWIQGIAALELDRPLEAEELFIVALKDVRELSQVGEEIPIRIGLAELRRRQGDLKAARESLDEMWEAAERGSFRLYQADAYNVLAQIERDAGHEKEAFEAATHAYRLAWCDGPPYAYAPGLEKARAHLLALHMPEPDLPPFDPTGREPIPEVQINPQIEIDPLEDL